MFPESGRSGEEIRPGVWSRGRRQSDPRTPWRPPRWGRWGAGTLSLTRTRKGGWESQWTRSGSGYRGGRWQRIENTAASPSFQPPTELRCGRCPRLVGGGWAWRRRRRMGERGDEAMGPARTRKEKDEMNCGPYSIWKRRLGRPCGPVRMDIQEKKSSNPLWKTEESKCICLNFHDLTCV